MNWDDVYNKKLNVPKPYLKKVVKGEVSPEKVFGKDAFDVNIKDINKV